MTTTLGTADGTPAAGCCSLLEYWQTRSPALEAAGSGAYATYMYPCLGWISPNRARVLHEAGQDSGCPLSCQDSPMGDVGSDMACHVYFGPFGAPNIRPGLTSAQTWLWMMLNSAPEKHGGAFRVISVMGYHPPCHHFNIHIVGECPWWTMRPFRLLFSACAVE